MIARWNKRLAALLMCIIMAFSALPITAIAEPATPLTSKPVTDLTELTEGTKVVIVNPANKKALSTVYSGYYNTGKDVSFTDGELTGFTADEVWTIGKDGENYTLATNEGKKLSMGTSYTSTPLDEVNDTWSILAAATKDCFYIQNVARGNYLEWYAGKNNWSTYGTIGTNEALFAQMIYRVTGDIGGGTDPEPDPKPQAVKMSALPNAGDTILIYNPANSAVMGNTASGAKLSGVSAAAAEDKITLADTMAQLVVEELGDEQYAFKLGTKYLTSGATGNALRYSDTLDDCGKWKFEKQTDGTWYLMNVGANYNGKYNQALEYYKGFTTYGVKANNGAYKMELYLVKAAGFHGTYVVYNPGSGKAMSADATGTHYRVGVDFSPAANGLQEAPDALLWNFTRNADNTYTITTQDGKKLSMNASKNSLPLDEVNDTWHIVEAATDGCYYLVNANRPTYYVEWYAKYTEFSTYTYSASNENIYAMQLLPAKSAAQDTDGLPAEGDKVVLYNQSAEGVLAGQDDNAASPSITNAAAELSDGKALPANGARVFTVQKNGEYYRFYNETDGYLCANGTGNNAFYAKTAADEADWTVTECDGGAGGWDLESRVAKYNGYGQWLEYYGGTYKTYSMNPATVKDYTIYSFSFYPLAKGVQVTEGIVNMPTVTANAAAAYVGADYRFTFTVDAPFGITEVPAAELADDALAVTKSGETYSVAIPAAKITGTELSVVISGRDSKDTAFTDTVKIPVVDQPFFTDMTPVSGAETGENKRPVISVKAGNCGDAPTITMKVNDREVAYSYAEGLISYTPAADMPDGRVTVTVTVDNSGKVGTANWSFTVGKATYQRYFGQLHSHTGEYSDGSGTLAAGLDYIKNLPDSANVDFVAFTDHSNYFDQSGAANPEDALYDMSKATAYSRERWTNYTTAINAFNASQSKVVALPGFEMTWSGGPGHINTFNTPGIVSRNNTTLNNKTADAGMRAYYALLSRAEGADSISQFNHPGSTFGTFTDFSYWDAVLDTRIKMIEVGNGEGQIGQGGYYPSYEYYTMALDKGWHLAPTNNQDNHKGKWGNANDARDVVITDDFSVEGLYEAISSYRMYATEDKNLEIDYTVNGLMMGSIIETVPKKLNVEVFVNDPDQSDSISKVEVIVNSGKVAYTWNDPAQLAAGNLTAELDAAYSYYYLRVTEGDGDLAVTAPVWVGETLKLGISAVECATDTPVTGEELTLTTTLFNSESAEATVTSLTYAIKGGEVIGTDTNGYTVPSGGTLGIPFAYTPTTAKLTTITVTVNMMLNGVPYTYSKDIALDVLNADSLVYIGIDASHYNEYVAGNYKDSMGNFGQLAASYGVRTVQLNTGDELIAACSNPKFKALILTAPSRRLADAQADPRAYSSDEIAAVQHFNEAGGVVILAGWSDYYENYEVITSNPDIKHMAAVQNELLTALGSCLRIGDDATHDDVLNGGQTHRLYFNAYGPGFLTEGVEVDAEHPNDRMYTEVFSHYGGASVYTVDGTLPAGVTPVVFGHTSTYSKDGDNDGLGGAAIPKYAFADGDNRLMIMATEQLENKGLIIVSGAAFMSNFEVQATVEDTGSEKNYANYKICENLVQMIHPVQITDIATVQAQTETGYRYTIEGVVTSNASGFDKNTAFFDCIYVQDETGGICCFPVAGNFKVGDKVRINGTTDFYQGEMELQVSSITLLSENNPVKAVPATADQINSKALLGLLVELSGTVVSFEKENGLVQTIMVRDAAGKVARVFIDGYITTDQDVKDLAVGRHINVTGIASYDNTFNAPEGPFARIRIRNRADVVCSTVTPPASYNVTFNMGGHGTQVAQQTVADGSKAAKPTDPTESGYTFKGWYTDAAFRTAFDFNTAIHADTTLYAKWVSNAVTPVDPAAPETGDNSHMLLWVLLLAAGGAALTGSAIDSRKRRHN